jgi:hypothetical protein
VLNIHDHSAEFSKPLRLLEKTKTQDVLREANHSHEALSTQATHHLLGPRPLQIKDPKINAVGTSFWEYENSQAFIQARNHGITPLL